MRAIFLRGAKRLFPFFGFFVGVLSLTLAWRSYGLNSENSSHAFQESFSIELHSWSPTDNGIVYTAEIANVGYMPIYVDAASLTCPSRQPLGCIISDAGFDYTKPTLIQPGGRQLFDVRADAGLLKSIAENDGVFAIYARSTRNAFAIHNYRMSASELASAKCGPVLEPGGRKSTATIPFQSAGPTIFGTGVVDRLPAPRPPATRPGGNSI